MKVTRRFTIPRTNFAFAAKFTDYFYAAARGGMEDNMAQSRLIGRYPVIGIRPAAWNAFGMDKEGQDYRACAAFGAQFKK